jgi:hypothetical protein
VAANQLRSLPILRILDAQRRGSSRPLLVETSAGPQMVKLRGAAQGTGPLVAEIIVAELAAALGLAAPARTLLTLAADTPTDDREDELADLLAASVGTNLGFAWMDGAREATADDLGRMPDEAKAAILWLDRFAHNPDRTARNPNLLWWNGRAWLIDHGAALRFQYDWSRVTEETPRAAGTVFESHLFEGIASAADWPMHDEACAARITREVLAAAVAAVPDEFLRLERATYVAYLWKRVRAPRAFAQAGPSPIAPPGARGVPPAWLARR